MKIFIADFLPIKNKGEEAILRGIQSLYEEAFQENIELYVFGSSDTIVKEDNITSFPVNWCYPTYKYPQKFVGRMGLIRRLICAFFFRLGIFPYVSSISKHPEVLSALKAADVILLAHDGFYHTFCAGLGLYIKRMGLHYSVPGTGFRPIKKYSFANKQLDYKFFSYSNLNVLRENTCYEYLQELNLSKGVYLLPDMAFYCKSTPDEISESRMIAEKYKIGFDKNLKYIGLTI